MNQLVLHNMAQAKQAMPKFLAEVKNALDSGNKQIVESRDFEDKLSDQQRRYYHGYILNEIAKQARVDGKQFSLQTWKEHMRKTYLGSKRVKEINPLTGRKYWYLKRISSEDLGVRGYNRLIDLVTNVATEDLGVNFYIDFDTWIAENEI